MTRDDLEDAQAFYSISNLLFFAAKAVHTSPDTRELRDLWTFWLESSLSASTWALRQAGIGGLEVVRPTHDDPVQLLKAARTLAFDSWNLTGDPRFKTLANATEALEDGLVFPGLLC